MDVTRELLERVVAVAEEAGRAILAVYDRGEARVTVEYKKDASPLTEADVASQEVIAPRLAALVPGVPILSEEAAALPWEGRQAWRRCWLVDPLDGTKEFIKRNGEFTVNIALVEDGAPVLGVVHAPALDRTYLGAPGLGAWRQQEGELGAIAVGGADHGPLRVVASRSHAGPMLSAFLEALPVYRLVSMGSSLKLCLVADGSADCYPRLSPTMEWDVAAADAVVRAAGGRVVDVEGKALTYNKPQLLNPHFLVLGERPVPWRAALEACAAATG